MPFTNSETKSLIDQCSSGGFQQTVAQKSNTKLPINLDLSEYPKIIQTLSLEQMQKPMIKLEAYEDKTQLAARINMTSRRSEKEKVDAIFEQLRINEAINQFQYQEIVMSNKEPFRHQSFDEKNGPDCTDHKRKQKRDMAIDVASNADTVGRQTLLLCERENNTIDPANLKQLHQVLVTQRTKQSATPSSAVFYMQD